MRATLAVLFLSTLSFAKDLEQWEIDKQHSFVTFTIGHLGISKVVGTLAVNEGSIKTNPQDVTQSQLDVKIDVKSLNTGVQARDQHVKSDDFLSAEKFPSITFKSLAVREDKTSKKLSIEGDLTVKGKTRRVILEADPISDEVRLPKDGAEKVVRATKATLSINRFDYGIEYGKTATGPKKALSTIVDGGVGRDIDITIHTEFFKIVTPPPASTSTTTNKS